MPRRRTWWMVLAIALLAQSLVVVASDDALAGWNAHGLQPLFVNPGGGVQADGSDGMRLQVNGSVGQDEIRFRNTTQYCCSSVAPVLNIGGTLWGEAGPGYSMSGTSWTSVEYVAMSGSSSSSGGTDKGSGTAHVRYTAVQDGLTYVLDREVGYTYPNSYYTDTYTVTIPDGNDAEVKLYFGGDTAPGGSDHGYGIMLTQPVRSVISLNQDSGILVGYREVAGSKAFDGATSQNFHVPYAAVWAGGDIGFTATPSAHDAGLMVQWDFGTQAGAHTAKMQVFTTAQGTGLSAEFRESDIVAGASVLLDLSVVNSSLSTVNDFGYTFNLPAGLLVAGDPPTNGCGGDLTATTASSVVTLANGTVDGAANCVVSVPVTTATPGTYTIGAASVASLESLSNEVGTSSLTVAAGPLPPSPAPPAPGSPTPIPSPTPEPGPPACPAKPVEVTTENAKGAGIAWWVCRMHLVGGRWQERNALVLLPPNWFTCPSVPARHWPTPGVEFGTWLLQVHCGYRPIAVRTRLGVAWALEPPLPRWLSFWFGTG